MHYLSSIHPFCVAGYMYIAKVHLWVPPPWTQSHLLQGLPWFYRNLFKFVIRNLCQSSPNETILVPFVFFYLSELMLRNHLQSVHPKPFFATAYLVHALLSYETNIF